MALTLANEGDTVPRKRKSPGRYSVSPLIIFLGAVLLLLIVPPTYFLVQFSFREVNADGSLGAFTLSHYRKLVESPYFFTSLWTTTLYALGSATVAIVIGTVQALIVERTNAPGRSWAFLGAIISLAIPNVLYVVSWLLILGRSGPLNRFLTSMLGEGAVQFNAYSLPGMILIEGIGFVPLTFLMMSSILRSMDASFEEASMMSGAKPVRTFMSITLRMGMPGILALLILVFIRAFESFEVPALVGLAGNINVLTTDIYQNSRSTGIPNYGESGAYSVCLLVIVAMLLAFYGRLSKGAHRFQTITGKGFRPRVIDLGKLRYAASAILVAIFVFVAVLPLAMLVFASFQPFYVGITGAAIARSTLDNYSVVMGPSTFRDAISNTLVLGAATATLVVPFTAICAWLAIRKRGGWILDQIATIPLVFPAIVMSVAFLYVFLSLPLPLYGTLLSIAIASAVRYLPYGMRYAYTGVLQIHKDLEDASMLSGGRDFSTFCRVVIPLLMPALIGAWLFVFLLSVQAVSLPLLLAGPGTEIVSVTLFELWINGQVTELAAMGVVWVSMMIVVCTIFYYLTRRYQLSVA